MFDQITVNADFIFLVFIETLAVVEANRASIFIARAACKDQDVAVKLEGRQLCARWEGNLIFCILLLSLDNSVFINCDLIAVYADVWFANSYDKFVFFCALNFLDVKIFDSHAKLVFDDERVHRLFIRYEVSLRVDIQ